jgi:hypothetical protein
MFSDVLPPGFACGVLNGQLKPEDTVTNVGAGPIGLATLLTAQILSKITIMRTTGIVIFIVGLLMTLYTGFTYVTEEKVVDFGELEITKDNPHTVNWQPYVGIGTMVIGGVVFIRGRKKSGTT